ncbi:sarcosine oxidase subunit delta [Pararhodospirillum photometricum]|uniref:sarcosine oxidase subunit delta n=1 Tax=Pararhodospirillum photometricum TaxID=1084 RepID=UPI0002FBD587|nr:sarcosine oxidase subunit delta [Pararhodospirillum photometricum]
MRTLTCPRCGRRPLREFDFGGTQPRAWPDADPPLPPDAWAALVYLRDASPELQQEWWWHGDGCGLWLHVTRDPQDGRVVDVLAAGDTP